MAARAFVSWTEDLHPAIEKIAAIPKADKGVARDRLKIMKEKLQFASLTGNRVAV
ncbi:MAG TPA: hypothetical protein VG844_18160 [Terracidiphilus sp.]|nr:hypothetical protein [Terracidiphilus sp.]